MTRSELKALVADACIDPFQANDLTPITLAQAESWLQDIFRDQDLAELEPDERIPKDTTPAAFMEAWNEICIETNETCEMFRSVLNGIVQEVYRTFPTNRDKAIDAARQYASTIVSALNVDNTVSTEDCLPLYDKLVDLILKCYKAKAKEE